MTEWEPATEAEAAMRDALRANDQELYFRILSRTELLLPVSAHALPGTAAMGWGTWTTSGRTHVLAFTSGPALQACLAENAGAVRRTAYHELASGWPNQEWWLAVNPGLPIEGYLPAWFVAQLSQGDVRLPGRTMAARARLERAENSARARATAAVPDWPAPTGEQPSGPGPAEQWPGATPTEQWSGATRGEQLGATPTQPRPGAVPAEQWGAASGEQRPATAPAEPWPGTVRPPTSPYPEPGGSPFDGPTSVPNRQSAPPNGQSMPAPNGQAPNAWRGPETSGPEQRPTIPESRGGQGPFGASPTGSTLTAPGGPLPRRPLPPRPGGPETNATAGPTPGAFSSAPPTPEAFSSTPAAPGAFPSAPPASGAFAPAGPPPGAAQPTPPVSAPGIHPPAAPVPAADSTFAFPASAPGGTAGFPPAAPAADSTFAFSPPGFAADSTFTFTRVGATPGGAPTFSPDAGDPPPAYPAGTVEPSGPPASPAAPPAGAPNTASSFFDPHRLTPTAPPHDQGTFRGPVRGDDPYPAATHEDVPAPWRPAAEPAQTNGFANANGGAPPQYAPAGPPVTASPVTAPAEPVLPSTATAPDPQAGSAPGVSAPAAAGPLRSDFTPANEVEHSLLAAASDGSTDTFLSTLLLAKVLLPASARSVTGSRPGDDGFDWRTESLDGEEYVVVFTSPERLADHLPPPVETVAVKFVQLIRKWPDEAWSFAVNPGTPVGAKLPGAQIVALANWAAEVGLGDDLEPVESVEVPAAEEPAPRSTYAPVREDPTRPTMMQKAIAPSQLAYYLDRSYDRVSGFVHRANEVAHLNTPAKLYAALGLGYSGSPFSPDATEVYLLRWPAHRPGLYRIPYGGQNEPAMRAMEGWVIERPPFRGNGFAPGDSSDVIAEFKVDSVRLPYGTELWRIGIDGSEQLVARLDTDVTRWRRVGGD